MSHYDTGDEKKKRKKVYEEYTPIVLWVQVDGIIGKKNSFQRIKHKAKELLNELPFVKVAGRHEPYNELVTEFDEKQVEEN